MRRMSMISLALLALVTACGAAPQSAAPSAPQTLAAPTVTTIPEESRVPRTTATALPDRPTPATERTSVATPAAASEVPVDLMNKILADAAKLSGVDAAAISVQTSQAAEWPDGSLGCPQPGTAYLQVITYGYQVVLRAGTNSYDYRADGGGRFFVCKK